MFALEIKAELEGVTNLRPNDTKETPFWYMFKVQCTSCRETHSNFVGVNRFEANEMSGSRGEANFVWKCKNCKRESSASIKSAPVPYQQSEPPKSRRILEFDCRGLEFTEFMPEGEWLAEGIDSGTKFTGIELVEGEWFDYDEKAGEEHFLLPLLPNPETGCSLAMNSDQLAAKVDFLTDAAHLLRGSAPETSAHLMRHRSDLMSLAGVPQPQLQRQHVCSACGHIMIPGKGALAQTKAKAKTTEPLEAPKKSANASSKQRAKDRKAGLQALLSRQQPAARSSLTLNDFMRRPVEEIESLCMNCGKNGVTKLLLTAIPYFRQVVIMSFSCEHCHAQNNEIQAAGAVQPKGVHYELRLTSLEDFGRQVIKSDTATVKFIELDLEIPAGRGQLTNVEGLLSTVVDDLEMGQEARKEQAPEIHDKIAEIVTKARAMLAGDAFPFRLYVDDAAGNSFISPDLKDGAGKWQKREYTRTAEQNAALGLGDGAEATTTTTTTTTTAEGDDGDAAPQPDEVYGFPASCPGCTHPCTTQMKMVDIPHFKQVILMSTVCDACGYRSNDVKTGGEIPPQGQRLTLSVTSTADLARDILKSESCALDCPQLNLHVNAGTLGGRFTTVEGLLTQVRADLHGHMLGDDSLSREEKEKWSDFFVRLDDAVAGNSPFTLVLSDPLAASFIQPLADPASGDDRLKSESYRRSPEEDEELGLTDMRTE
ncbi:hypothetical protein CP533_2360 [Ophiocordyceps camponoti-saundersi (nom. inval.)]|nr:hypothetical protein CP533_2360 [Ophiocordyceps camponoti-saundersi (nom. inval.)]